MLNRINLPFKIKKPVLAMGANTKNTMCFLKKNNASLSRLHKDLRDAKDLSLFEKDLKRLLALKPEIIAHDLHPEYICTKHALGIKNIKFHPVQHHHAHIASCMAENLLKNAKVIGVAFDGTGMAEDNTIWGGEFFVCDYLSYTRMASLKRIPLLGAERAIHEPMRIALLWLYRIYGDRLLELGIDFVRKLSKKRFDLLKEVYLKEINSPQTTSMGRLFDAAASMIMSRHFARYEAELAIDLEKLASRYKKQTGIYSIHLKRQKELLEIDPAPMFKEIVGDLKRGRAKEAIACSFHLTIAETIKRVCLELRRTTYLNKVILCGGVFQNNILLNLTSGLLYKEGFRVFSHKRLSPGDSSLSLGQAVIAGFRS